MAPSGATKGFTQTFCSGTLWEKSAPEAIVSDLRAVKNNKQDFVISYTVVLAETVGKFISIAYNYLSSVALYQQKLTQRKWTDLYCLKL